MSGASVRRERFLPYAYDRAALGFDVVTCTCDDTSVVIGESKTIELPGDWHTADIELRATLPADLARHLVPAGKERAEPPVAVLVALRCESTRLRRGLVLPIVDGLAVGTMRIRHDDLAGTAELHAWVVRTRPHPRRAPGFALAAGARLGHAPGWTLQIDGERANVARGIDVQFKSFAADPSIPSAERGNLYRFDGAQDEPVLWLNVDHGPIAQVLRSEGTRGQLARQRDVVFERIIAAVRTQLVLRAAVHATGDGAVYAWERAVLADVLPKLYPNVSASDRLDRLRAEVADPADLVGRLDDLMQASERTAHALLSLLEEG